MHGVKINTGMSSINAITFMLRENDNNERLHEYYRNIVEMLQRVIVRQTK